MIDLITVVFKDELKILQAQAESVAKYCKQLNIGNIYVVVNDIDSICGLIDGAWWGELSDHVIVTPRSVFSTKWADNGWVSQQALKMMTAAISYNKYSIILDAKTIFVRELTLDQLFNGSGQIQAGHLDVFPVFEPSRKIVNQIWNIDLQKQAGPGGVPFIVCNDIVRAMIADVYAYTHQDFPTWFQSQGMVTEFMLYSGYIVKGAGSLDVLYTKHNALGIIVNVCHSEVESWDRKFADMKHPKTLSVSVHRAAWAKLTTEQKQQYQTFLIDRGVTQAWQL
jgi:hypothetical protein